MAMKAKSFGLAKPAKEEAKVEEKVSKKSEEPKKAVPYRYRGADGNWAWKLK
tara:strand:+ start:195 stop:350 length:156 start_codon:yes stop_codon:yes gene_type:complete